MMPPVPRHAYHAASVIISLSVLAKSLVAEDPLTSARQCPVAAAGVGPLLLQRSRSEVHHPAVPGQANDAVLTERLARVEARLLRDMQKEQATTSAWRGAGEGPAASAAAPNRLSGGSAALVQPAEPTCNSKLKLVVNSHVDYGKVLPLLWTSLLNSGFKRFQDVIVFRGGAARDSQPEVDDRGVTFVNVTIDAFDYNGLSGLYHHRDDPRVCAHAYLYTLDAVEVDSTFPAAFDRLEDMGLDEVRMAPRPANNILAFGHNVVERYGTTYDHNLTKKMAWQGELGDGPKVEDFAAHVTMQAGRIDDGTTVDVYNTGHPRRKVYFPDLGISKYILWNQYGDINGDGQVHDFIG